MQNEQIQTEVINDTDQKKSKRKLWVKLLWLAIALVVVMVAILSLGIYKLGWKGDFVNKILTVVPYPIALVDWRPITIADFQNRFKAYQNAVEFNQAFDFSDPANAEIIKEQRSALLDRMIDLKLEQLIAGTMDVKVSQEDIEGEIKLVAKQSGVAIEDLDQLLQNIYGWSRMDFTKQVMIPQILERKLQYEIVSDKEINAEAYKKAQEVKSKLTEGAAFAELAREYSDDFNTKEVGGDLGWSPKGYFVPEFEQAAFVLAPGEVSEIIASPFGFHIIEMLDKSASESGEELFHTRHILIAGINFSEWLAGQREKASIWKFEIK